MSRRALAGVQRVVEVPAPRECFFFCCFLKGCGISFIDFLTSCMTSNAHGLPTARMRNLPHLSILLLERIRFGDVYKVRMGGTSLRRETGEQHILLLYRSSFSSHLSHFGLQDLSLPLLLLLAVPKAKQYQHKQQQQQQQRREQRAMEHLIRVLDTQIWVSTNLGIDQLRPKNSWYT